MKLSRIVLLISIVSLFTLGSFSIDNSNVEPIVIEKSTCQEDLMVGQRGGGKNIYNVTIVRIGLAKIYYKKCNSEDVIWIKKDHLLAVKYANGKMDKFDFNGQTNKKKGKWLVRSKKSVDKKRNEPKK